MFRKEIHEKNRQNYQFVMLQECLIPIYINSHEKEDKLQTRISEPFINLFHNSCTVSFVIADSLKCMKVGNCIV